MAEREGFEPSEEITSFAGLANLWFKPLTHLSIAYPWFVIRAKTLCSLSLLLIHSFYFLMQPYHDIPLFSMSK